MEQKALLLLDNAPSHPSSATLRSEDGKIKTLFLPPNTTSLIQPMDQAVLDPLKKRYKRRLLHHLIIENESSELSVPEILKTITLKDVVYWIAEAWSEASCDSLRKAWRNLLPEPDMSDQSEGPNFDHDSNEIDLGSFVGTDVHEAVAEWIDADLNDPGHQILEDSEIVANILTRDNSDEESEDEVVEDVHAITPHEAFNALDVSLIWLESIGVEPAQLLQVKKWRDMAARIRQESLRQTSIRTFFAPLVPSTDK